MNYKFLNIIHGFVLRENIVSLREKMQTEVNECLLGYYTVWRL
jgi:hypothetical protein